MEACLLGMELRWSRCSRCRVGSLIHISWRRHPHCSHQIPWSHSQLYTLLANDTTSRYDWLHQASSLPVHPLPFSFPSFSSPPTIFPPSSPLHPFLIFFCPSLLSTPVSSQSFTSIRSLPRCFLLLLSLSSHFHLLREMREDMRMPPVSRMF